MNSAFYAFVKSKDCSKLYTSLVSRLHHPNDTVFLCEVETEKEATKLPPYSVTGLHICSVHAGFFMASHKTHTPHVSKPSRSIYMCMEQHIGNRHIARTLLRPLWSAHQSPLLHLLYTAILPLIIQPTKHI